MNKLIGLRIMATKLKMEKISLDLLKKVCRLCVGFVAMIRGAPRKSKKKVWRCGGLNPGPFTCKANALPLSYIPDGCHHNYSQHLLLQNFFHVKLSLSIEFYIEKRLVSKILNSISARWIDGDVAQW